MTVFNETNKEAEGPVSEGSSGPKLGFLGAWQAAYDDQVRNSSVFGMENAFREVEQEQIQALRKAGVAPHASLNDTEDGAFLAGGATAGGRKYRSAAQFFEDGGTPEQADFIAKRDAEIEKLRAANPSLGLRTYSEMWDEVKGRAHKAEQTWDSAPTSAGGSVGGFLAGAVAGMDPRSDPLNLASAPIGGFGKTGLLRMAEQGGIQAVAETINQATGVQENRRLLGLSNGLGDAASRVGMAAVAGVGFQGLVEGGTALGRRWFRGTPKDPAPPPPKDSGPLLLTYQPQERGKLPGEGGDPIAMPNPMQGPRRPVDLLQDFDAFMGEMNRRAAAPLGPSRVAAARGAEDLAHVVDALDNWGGPRPSEIPPKTATALPQPVTSYRIEGDVRQRVADGMKSVDDLAREVDPQTFSVFDKLRAKADELRGVIGRATEAQGAHADALRAAQEHEAQVAQLTQQLEATKGKAKRAKLEEQIAALQAGRPDAPPMPADVNGVREQLQKIDQQMRDMAPVVSRAYKAAKGQWAGQRIDPDALRVIEGLEGGVYQFRAGDGKTTPHILKVEHEPLPAPRETVADVVPEMRDPSVVEKLGPNADAADAVRHVAQERAKIVDANLDAFRAKVAKVVGDALDGAKPKDLPKPKPGEPDPNIVVFGDGSTLHLDNDRMPIVDDNGNVRDVSVREYLAEIEKDNRAAEATVSCSAPGTS